MDESKPQAVRDFERWTQWFVTATAPIVELQPGQELSTEQVRLLGIEQLKSAFRRGEDAVAYADAIRRA